MEASLGSHRAREDISRKARKHGGWGKGQMEGNGKMSYAATGDTYKGGWKMGKRSGAGQLVCSNGIVWSGEWVEDELEDEEPGSLLEAIEYCHSEQLGSWLGTEGATDWLQRVVLRLLNGGPRAAVGVPGVEGAAPEADLARKRLRSWEADLARIETDFQATEEEAEEEEEEEDQKEEEEEEAPDLLMYTGMFRTAMDMLSDAGELLRVVEVNSDDEEDGDTS